ncbi:hypothetical protein [Arcticibacter sp.]
METRKVKHVDGVTDVIAKGRVINGEFVGEYKFQGMTYGITIKA